MKSKKISALTVLIIILVTVLGIFYVQNKSISITILDNGKLIKKISVKKNTKIKDLENPQKNGYKFLYYTKNDAILKDDEKLIKDTTLNAIFQELYIVNGHTIKFDTAGGNIIDDIIVIDGNLLAEPKNPIKDGYIFKYWELDGYVFDFNTPIVRDITLNAVWEKYDEDVKLYTVTFNSNGGSAVLSKTVKENFSVVKPSNPIKNGYTFIEWQLNGKSYNFNTPVTQNITLNAVWKKNTNEEEKETYTVIFDSNGGTKISNQTIEKNKLVTRPSNPTKNGYTFIEWQLNGKSYDFNTPVTQNMTLHATWNEVKVEKTYIITFDANGGTASFKSKTIKYGNYGELPTATRNGYKFLGWSTIKDGGIILNENSLIQKVSDHTLYAQWEKIVKNLYWNDNYSGYEYQKDSFPSSTYSSNISIPNISKYSVYIKTSSDKIHHTCMYYNSKEFCAKSSYSSNNETAMNEFKNNIKNSLGLTNITCEYNSEVANCYFDTYSCMLFFESNDVLCSHKYNGYEYACSTSNGSAGCDKYTYDNN